jgi:hypothetical protein
MAVAQGWIGIKGSFLNSSARFQKLPLDNWKTLCIVYSSRVDGLGRVRVIFVGKVAGQGRHLFGLQTERLDYSSKLSIIFYDERGRAGARIERNGRVVKAILGGAARCFDGDERVKLSPGEGTAPQPAWPQLWTLLESTP